jgi:hypothetical protein
MSSALNTGIDVALELRVLEGVAFRIRIVSTHQDRMVDWKCFACDLTGTFECKSLDFAKVEAARVISEHVRRFHSDRRTPAPIAPAG